MTEPSAEHLIAQMAGVAGWDFFNPAMLAQARAQQAQDEGAARDRLAAVAGALYVASPEFRELYEWVLDQSVRRVAFIANGNLTAEQVAIYGAFREGQNSFAAALAKLIAEGRKLQEKARQL